MTTKFVKLMATGCLIALAACTSNADIDDQNIRTRQDIELTVPEAEMALNFYEYPVDLLLSAYQNEPEGNVLVSPLSSSMVLGMIANAIDSDQRENLLKALNIEKDQLQLFNEYNGKLMKNLPSIDKSAIFNINNGFWLKNSGTMSKEYTGVLDNHFNAYSSTFDNFNSSVLAEINNWISDKTNNAIKDLLTEKDITSQIVSLWVNALYFKGNWMVKFDEEKTAPAVFYSNYPDKSSSSEVTMMRGSKFPHAYAYVPEGLRDIDANAIVSVMLPYGNESFIFNAILPSENEPDIIATLKRLTPDYWKIVDKICDYKVEEGGITATLPKMHIEKTTDLIPLLQTMGMSEIFTGVSMQENLGLTNDVCIGLFRQKVVLDVDEKGSEAKVATVAAGMVAATPPTVIEFNRPFIYFIRERSKGSVILAGVYSHP